MIREVEKPCGTKNQSLRCDGMPQAITCEVAVGGVGHFKTVARPLASLATSASPFTVACSYSHANYKNRSCNINFSSLSNKHKLILVLQLSNKTRFSLTGACITVVTANSATCLLSNFSLQVKFGLLHPDRSQSKYSGSQGEDE